MSKSVYTTISTILLKQISQAQPIPGLRQLRRGRPLSLQAAMFGVDACAAQLDHFAAERFVRREIKLALAVIADVRRGVRAGLQSICANNFAGGEVFNDHVIANVIEGIDIEAGEMRLPQALVQFQVENLKP